MTLTKIVLQEKLREEIGLTKSEAKGFVNDFFDTLKDAIVSGEEVKIYGFGNFNVKNKTARPGRNPKTLEDIEISARRVCTFRAGKKLRDSIGA